MSKRLVLVAALVVAAVATLGVSGGASARGAKCGKLTMDENAWAGATANVYVVKYVLEKNLGCSVNIVKLPESTPLFQAMTDGKVDVVLEDWNNIQLKINRHFITKEKSIIDLGPSGVVTRWPAVGGGKCVPMTSTGLSAWRRMSATSAYLPIGMMWIPRATWWIAVASSRAIALPMPWPAQDSTISLCPCACSSRALPRARENGGRR